MQTKWSRQRGQKATAETLKARRANLQKKKREFESAMKAEIAALHRSLDEMISGRKLLLAYQVGKS